MNRKEVAYWLQNEFIKIGYRNINFTSREGYLELYFSTHNDKKFKVVYIDQPISIGQIKDLFVDGTPPLIIVNLTLALLSNSSAIGDKDWLQAIHRLYFGRIYVLHQSQIYALHLTNWEKGLHERQPVDFTDNIRLEMNNCGYKKGLFNIARFNDPDFWEEEQPKSDWGENWHTWDYEPQTRWRYTNYSTTHQWSTTNETPYDSEEIFKKWKEKFDEVWQRTYGDNFNKAYDTGTKTTNEDLNEQIRRAFNRNKQEYERYQPPPPPAPNYVPKGDKWFMMLMESGTLEGAKKKFRELAHQYHPDKAGDNAEAVAIMQAINAAYMRAKNVLG